MKRLGWKLIVLIIIALALFLWLVKAPIMSTYLSHKIRVPVSIEWISVWPSKTTMHKFKIKNPKGFKMPVAFIADLTEIAYDLEGLVGDPIVIDQIIMDGVFLGVEFTNAAGTVNNWTEIGGQMPPPKGKKEMLIHSLVLTNLTVEISGLAVLGKPTTKTVSRIEFQNINSAKGFPTEELVRALFGSAGMEEFLQNSFHPQQALDKLFNPFKVIGE